MCFLLAAYPCFLIVIVIIIIIIIVLTYGKRVRRMDGRTDTQTQDNSIY